MDPCESVQNLGAERLRRVSQDGHPFEVMPIIDERYPQEQLICQAWRTFDDHCWTRVCPDPGPAVTGAVKSVGEPTRVTGYLNARSPTGR